MTNQPLRVGLIADLTGPIPPVQYGGIERIVHLIAEGLVSRGHDVTLFASDDSEVNCNFVPFGHRRTYSLYDEWPVLAGLFKELWKRRRDFDVVHSFGRTLYLTPLLTHSLPKIQSYQCPINRRNISVMERLSSGTLTFTACSQSTANEGKGIGTWEVIPNAVPLSRYQFRNGDSSGNYLAFLGRIDRIKGVHTAIKVARECGIQLVIAGNVAKDGADFDYFKTEIEPHIDDRAVKYIGPVNDQQKNEFLGQAKALLFPVEWEEPFGIVLAEAMACGTPVVAFRRGAVPEVLTHGSDGFICDTAEEMVSAVKNVEQLDRANCRAKVEQKFSDDVIVSEYVALYRKVIAKAR